MRPARSRRVQAQRKFAQGAYVPPNAVAVVAVENRRDVVQDARNVTINHMTATSLLDVVSLQSAASTPERSGLHSHLTSQPVVLIERLRGKNPARDVPAPPPPQTETSPPAHPKFTNKNTVEPPKLNIVRKKPEFKRIHAMSLRSRRLSKLEMKKILTQKCAPSRKNPSKRKKTSSDEDEPLIFQKTRKKSPAAAAASEISARAKSLKVTPSKGADVRRKVTVKERKTIPASSRNNKEESSKINKIVSKRISKEYPPKKSEITAIKKTLTSARELIKEAAFDNLVAVDPVIPREDPVVTPVDPAIIPVGPELAPVGPALVPDGKAVVSDNAVIRPVNRVVVPDSPLAGPDAPVEGPDAPVGSPDAPVQVPVVGPDVPVVRPNAGLLYNSVVALPFSPIKEDVTPEQCAQIIPRLDGALSHADELPDLNNLLDCENDQMVLNEVKDEVPLSEGDTAVQEDIHSTASSNSPLVYRWTTSDDEPSVRCEAPSNLKRRSTNDSPAPGPSGVQNQISKIDSDTDEDNDDETELTSVIRKIMNKADVQVAMSRMDQKSPMNCVAASWRTEQDVINASTEQLESRCKACKHCQKLEKIINAVALLKTKTTEAQVTMKVRAPVIYGKAILGVNCERSDVPSTSKQNLFQLEGTGYVLDKLIDTLNISEGSEVNSEIQNNNPVSRRLSITSDSTGTSSDSNTEEEKTHRVRSERRKMKYQKVFATRRRLADAKAKQDRIRQEEECDNRRIEQRKKDEIALEPQKKNCDVAEIARLTERFEELQKEKAKEIARLKAEIRNKVRAELEADRRLCEEVDSMAQMLDNEKDAKSMLPKPWGEEDDELGTSELATEGGTLVDAPVYYPTVEEFKDPVSFFENIYPETMKYGVCKVVSPPGWRPPSEVHGDIRFDVMNQYISRLFSRWGPAARELSAIKLCLQQHTNINFGRRPPHLDGVEINLPKLYHLVQRLGGLESVINKKRWGKVADDLKITKAGHYEKKLDNIYVKYLLAYDTLSHQERQETMRKVEMSWNKKNQKLLDRAMNPLYRQQRMLGLSDSSDEETEDENTKVALKHAEDCIIKGQIMRHSRFRKVASLAFENTFGPSSEASAPPPLEHIEEQYWRLVTSGTEHVCVHTAAIDTGEAGHGFTTSVPPYANHAWNPKQVINNQRNVLRYLGPVVGVTLPTLLLGMLFSTSCWHKDPHCVAWYEYQSKGPTRIWYGIPADQADNFRKAVETLSPTSCQNKALWLSSEIAMIPPSVLREHNVRLTRVTQNEGEFIMAFPNAYTSCISTGYTESESVYFASADWLDAMWDAFKIARESCEPTMFSIEQLLYNIARDKDAEPGLLKRALPLYDKMLREETTNRQMLQERGLTCVQQPPSAPAEQQASSDNARPLEECDYCRASLFLSKVKGLPARNSVLCLEHTLALLDTERHRDADVRALALCVLVTVKELHRVHDDLRRRSAKPATARHQLNVTRPIADDS